KRYPSQNLQNFREHVNGERAMCNIPSTPDPLSEACQRVGRFLYHFARVEQRIDAAIAKLFDLKDDPADIITANIAFDRKINLIQSMVDLQSKERLPEWRTDATATINAVKGLNNPHRQIVAHSQFEPAADESVRFKRTIAKDTLKR